jgi:hypothetical protein
MGGLADNRQIEGDERMDLGTAAYWDTALAGLCVFTLGVALAVARRERMTASAIQTLPDAETTAGAKVRLLQLRADELAREVDELERAREELVLTGAGTMRGLELRATLGNGIPRDRPRKTVSIPEASAGS